MHQAQQDPHSSFICPICSKYSYHPVITQCGHLFCWPCLYSHTKQNPHCPLCTTFIQPQKAYPVFTQNEEDEGINQNQNIPTRPAPTYHDKILNPSMANGGMPLGISNLPHNIPRRKLVAGLSYFPSIFTNAFNSPDAPRPIDPDYQIYKKFFLFSTFLLALILITVVILIFF